MLGKLQRAHQTLGGHFAPTYLGGSNKLRAYQFFFYVFIPHRYFLIQIFVEDITEAIKYFHSMRDRIPM